MASEVMRMRRWLLAATLVALWQWRQEQIAQSEVTEQLGEIEMIPAVKERSVYSSSCTHLIENLLDVMMESGSERALFHGTVVFNGEDEEFYNIRPEVPQPLPQGKQDVADPRTWQLEMVSSKRRYRYAKRYDPAEYPELDHHCAFACMYYSLTADMPNRKAAQWMRYMIRREWHKAAANGAIAEMENLNVAQYQQKYLKGQGWGGLPEISAYAYATHKYIEIVDERYETMAAMGLQQEANKEVWRYHQEHYTVLKRSRTTHRWSEATGAGYSAFMNDMRGGMRRRSRTP